MLEKKKEYKYDSEAASLTKHIYMILVEKSIVIFKCIIIYERLIIHLHLPIETIYIILLYD